MGEIKLLLQGMWEASLANASASSFPSIPMCEGIHINLICLFARGLENSVIFFYFIDVGSFLCFDKEILKR